MEPVARTVADTALCHDCPWTDDRAGCRGRAGVHARLTGHEVESTRVITHPRGSAPLAGQGAFDLDAVRSGA